MREPLVSVVVPSYNYAHLIGRCVRSVLAQSCQDLELIVCDDRSGDDSVQVLQEFAVDARVSVRVNEAQLGLYGNVVRGISLARGQFIKILMADDWLHRDYLAETLATFERHPPAALCSVRTEVVNPAGDVVDVRCEPEAGREFYPRDIMLEWATREVNPIGNPSRVIFRRAAFDEAGGFDVAIEYCTEYELWLRMLAKWDCAAVPRVLSYETLHPTNATKTYVADGRHILTAEQMFVKLFVEHEFFRNHWARQQRVWFLGLGDYWDAALRHAAEGSGRELRCLIGLLWRRSHMIVWLPVLLTRGSVVLARKARAQIMERLRVGGRL